MIALAKYEPAWGDWPTRIGASWRDSAAAIIETGRLLSEARDALGTEFEKMIKAGLPFTRTTAQRLMIISSDETICAHVHKLPPAWGTLYELTKLPDAEKKKALSDNTIRPDTERAAVLSLRNAIERAPERKKYDDRVAAGCTVRDLEKLISDGFKYYSICADPPWPYTAWSDKGQDRAPERHYNTDALAGITSLPVKELAADNSVLHLWCVDWLLQGAIDVVESWGFKVINVGFVWVKINEGGEGIRTGLGKWTRHNCELCLFATRGNPRRMHADVQQVLEATLGPHSRKPDEIYRRIERLTPGPYLELYGRRQRPGWTVWGNEIPRDELQPPHDAETGEIPADKVSSPPMVNEQPLDGNAGGEHEVNVSQDDVPDFLRRQKESA